MAQVLEVAKFFLYLNQEFFKRGKQDTGKFEELPDPISHLKLQKLVYYAQGMSLAYRGESLFEDKIEAWEHGPVVKTLYHELKKHKNNDLMDQINFNDYCLNKEEKGIILLTFNRYGRYTATALRDMTHDESPYKDVFVMGNNNEITTTSMQNFFSQEREAFLDEIAQESEQYQCLFQS